MNEIKFTFWRPTCNDEEKVVRKDNKKYGIKETEVSFSTDGGSNIESLLSSPNAVDYVCESMKLVAIDKCFRKYNLEDFFKKCDRVESLVYELLLSLYPDEQSLNNVDSLKTKINSESKKLAGIFIDMVNKQ